MPIRFPFNGTFRMSQGFGGNAAFYGQFSYDGVPLKGHNGLDFAIPNGTEIVAVDDGTVMEIGFEANGFGNYVKLRHRWGESLYAHLESKKVKETDAVKAGDVVGLSDNTGASTGPHLHFGIRLNGYSRKDGWGGFSNPEPYLSGKEQLPGEQASSDCLAVVVAGDPQPLGWYRGAWADEKQQREQWMRRATSLQQQFDVERADLREQADLWRDQVAPLVKEYTGSQPTTDPIVVLRALIKDLKAKIDPTDPKNWERP